MNAKLAIGIAALALAGALSLAGSASGAPTRAAGTLQLNATLTTIRRNDSVYCPPGTPAATNCFRYVGRGEIPGLGPRLDRREDESEPLSGHAGGTVLVVQVDAGDGRAEDEAELCRMRH